MSRPKAPTTGGELVAMWKRDLVETKCCGLIVLPGVLTRLAMAREIDELVAPAVREALDARDKAWLEQRARGDAARRAWGKP